MAWTTVLGAGFAAFVTVWLTRRRKWANRSRGLPLPPSIKGLPLLGNALDIPTELVWEAYQQWTKTLKSDIVYANALGTSIVVLNSKRAAIDILDRQSLKTSGRYQSPVACDLIGWSAYLPMMPYGEEFKTHRKLFQQHFQVSDPKLYRARISENLPAMLAKLLEHPDDLISITQDFITSTVMQIAYGSLGPDTLEIYAEFAEAAMKMESDSAVPGGFLVDLIPILKYVPEWVPGAGFRKVAREWNVRLSRLAEEPFNEALKRINDGTAEPSFVSKLYYSAEEDGLAASDSHRIIKSLAATFHIAGTDSTIASLKYFYLAMMYYPNVQAKAQQELDVYLKGDRLPEFGDESNLPYITALVKELLRWQPIAPMGLPHFSTEDCFHEGYFIPKDSIIFANQWAMSYDEAEYPDPGTFNPERFLSPDGSLNTDAPDPKEIAFGFGRRVCPGSHMAYSALFVTISTILSLFEITKPDDFKFDLQRDIRLGFTRTPKDFKCAIRVRSGGAEMLIRSSVL
ncbi:cytochrome P450 [Coprinopsis marcescibilis]|uniref:Cytochrome P450 n=1 Tax=Coprinopsis marcescibilis TaxID=230819 RepID=A0A5C3KPM5_COPMA|nr:cytochrome P450 [Coprinopsis marcescibilis]